MSQPIARLSINISAYLHKRLRYQAFVRDTSMTQILERAAEGLVEYLEADDSVVSKNPQYELPHVTISTSVTSEQADLFNRLLDERGESSHEVLERAIIAYLANVPNTW